MRLFVLPFLEERSFAKSLQDKIVEGKDIESLVLKLRSQSKSIVTLNGSFDLLHAGHLEMIYQASLQGDILILGLNTDKSIQGYKSSKRPIVPLEQRMLMIGALEMVDYVTSFDELEPRELLKKIRPDVHVNGSEYGLNCIEAEVVKEGGGRLHIVSLVPGLSTSQLIHKIVTVCG